VFGWFKPKPRWRILEFANGKARLQKRTYFHSGCEAPGYWLYDTVDEFDHPADALSAMAQYNREAEGKRVVSETYWP
jgi:hypothetical protein